MDSAANVGKNRLQFWKVEVRKRYDEIKRVAEATKLSTSQSEDSSSVNFVTQAIDQGIKSTEAQNTEQDQDAAQSIETKTDDAGDRSVVQLGAPGLHQMSAVLKGDTVELIVIPTGSEANPNLVLQPSNFTPVNIPVAKSSTSVGTNHDESADIPATDLSVTKTSTSAGTEHGESEDTPVKDFSVTKTSTSAGSNNDERQESPVKRCRRSRLRGDLADPKFVLLRQIEWLQDMEIYWGIEMDAEWIGLGLTPAARHTDVASEKLAVANEVSEEKTYQWKDPIMP